MLTLAALTLAVVSATPTDVPRANDDLRSAPGLGLHGKPRLLDVDFGGGGGDPRDSPSRKWGVASIGIFLLTLSLGLLVALHVEGLAFMQTTLWAIEGRIIAGILTTIGVPVFAIPGGILLRSGLEPLPQPAERAYDQQPWPSGSTASNGQTEQDMIEIDGESIPVGERRTNDTQAWLRAVSKVVVEREAAGARCQSRPTVGEMNGRRWPVEYCGRVFWCEAQPATPDGKGLPVGCVEQADPPTDTPAPGSDAPEEEGRP